MRITKCLNVFSATILCAFVAFLNPLNSKAAISQSERMIMSRKVGSNTFFIPTNTKDTALSFETVSELKSFTRNTDNIGTVVTFYAYVSLYRINEMNPEENNFILYLASDSTGSFPIYGVGNPDDLIVYESDYIYYTGIYDGNTFGTQTWPTFRTINISFEEPIDDESDSFMSNEEAGDFVDVSDPSGYASLRSGPGTNYDQLYSIPNGENVLVLSSAAKHTNIQDKDWVEASYFIDGDWHDGWIQKSQLKFLY